jgi:C_GCAxxG_C_C family probable redox protein
MTDPDAIQVARARAEHLYRSGQYLCSEAVLLVANEHLGRPMPNEILRLASGFPVGMGMAGCVCGAVAGGVMALGLKLGREEPKAETPGLFAAVKELHDRFKVRRHSVCCRVLIGKLDFGSPRHTDQCVQITGEVAADVIEILQRIERDGACGSRGEEGSR